MRGSCLIVCAVLVAAMAVPAGAETTVCGGIAPLVMSCERTTTALTSDPYPAVAVDPSFLGWAVAEVSSPSAIRRQTCYFDLNIAFCNSYVSGVFSIGQALTLKGRVGGYRIPPVGRWDARVND